MKRIVVLSGAGISAESGIRTFRDANGLWEEHDVMEVASIDGWYANPQLVLDFYNARRKQLVECRPNAAHLALVELEKCYDVQIITQNVDDLHERAGSSNVLHLHGELIKARSTVDDSLVMTIEGEELNWGDTCAKGSQLRPHIVWFGEEVPLIHEAAEMVESADVLIVVGTSLNVYPAAGLIHYAGKYIPKYLVDPLVGKVPGIGAIEYVQEKATVGLCRLSCALIAAHAETAEITK